MNEMLSQLSKNLNYPLLYACGALFLTVITFLMTLQDNKQKDKIEQLGNINADLTREVQKLTAINNEISVQTKDMVAENKILTEHNNDLSRTANRIISEVSALTKASNNLIKQVDLKAEEQYAQLAMTGKLMLELDGQLNPTDVIEISLGERMKLGVEAVDFEGENAMKLVGVGDNIPIDFRVKEKTLLLSLIVYDLSGNWIVEIENNYWRRNPLMIGKFNYDKKGVEFIDNKNNVILNIDILKGDRISIQGFFVFTKQRKAVAFGKYRSFINLRDSPEEVQKWVDQAEIQQIFQYSGENWLGKRKN